MNNEELRWSNKEQNAYCNAVRFLISGNRKAYKYWKKQSHKFHRKWRKVYRKNNNLYTYAELLKKSKNRHP